MRILIAEDNDDARRFIAQSFVNVPDRQFLLTANSAEAWWHLSNPDEHFDLGIFDVNLPFGTGLELLARVRADPRIGGLKVLLLTAAPERATVLAAEKLKVAGFLAKPFSAAALQRKVLDVETSLLAGSDRRFGA